MCNRSEILRNMSAIDYSGSGTSQEIDNQGSVLPGYVPYLSLVFKMITTTVILLLSVGTLAYIIMSIIGA